MQGAMTASTYPPWLEERGRHLTACQAVEPLWDVEEPCRRDATFDLPIDHAAMLETLVPLLVIVMTLLPFLLSEMP